VEVGDDFHRPTRKQFEDILLDECLADSFELGELELRPEVVRYWACPSRAWSKPLVPSGFSVP